MSAPRGKGTQRRGAAGADERPPPRPDPAGAVPDLLRRMLGLGFSGLFMTEQVLRKALGDSVPKEWVDFAIEQSERTRRELVERVGVEIGRVAEGIDLRELAEGLLRGHVLEVSARVRFVPDEGAATAEPRLRVALARDGDGE
jgi:hypothetical protein